MLLSRNQGIQGDTLIRCRNKERSFNKDNYKKGLQRISISLICMSFSRDRYIRVVSYDPPQILHRYWGIYIPYFGT